MTHEQTPAADPTDPAVDLTALAPLDALAASISEVVQNARPMLAAVDATKKQVREARLECMRVRTAVEKTHKTLKAPILEIGRALDARKKELLALITPTEDALGAKEDRLEAEEAAAKEAARRAALEALEAIQRRFTDAGLPAPPLWMIESWTPEQVEEELRVGLVAKAARDEAARLERERAAAEAAKKADDERRQREADEAARAKERADRKEAQDALEAAKAELAALRAQAEKERLELARRLREAEEAQESAHVRANQATRQLEALQNPPPAPTYAEVPVLSQDIVEKMDQALEHIQWAPISPARAAHLDSERAHLTAVADLVIDMMQPGLPGEGRVQRLLAHEDDVREHALSEIARFLALRNLLDELGREVRRGLE